MTWDEIVKLVQQMFGASVVTLEVFFLTLLFSLPLGMLVALGRMSRWPVVQLPIRFYLLVMRGTPLILQLIFFYFGSRHLFGQMLPRFPAAILAFTLNYAAYFAEIYRGGLESVPKGQYEASSVLGFSKSQTFFRIILPQVVKRVVPPMGNEFMTLVKDTALAQTIGVMELFRLANTTASREFSTLPIFVAGLFYLVMNAVVAKCFSLAEKRMEYYQ